MLSLAIYHNIHLTKEERYSLHEGTTLVKVGVSVPVWFVQKKTSEPAKEVFCNYYLSNPKQDVPIKILEDGYDISLPYREGTKLNISDDEWRYLLLNNSTKLDALYKNITPEISSKLLLEPRDGGCNGMSYREHNKIDKDGQLLSIMHYISIERIEVLEASVKACSMI